MRSNQLRLSAIPSRLTPEDTSQPAIFLRLFVRFRCYAEYRSVLSKSCSVFTRDTAQSAVFSCDWADVGCGNVTGRFVQLGTPRPGADFYLEIGFTSGAGSIAPNGQSGEIQVRVNKSDWSMFNQSGDYSFDRTKTAFADWTKVALYRNGTLIWGTTP